MKLFTKDIDKKLFAQFPKGGELANQKVIAKIFNPYGRGVWYIINSDPNDPDYLWAIVNLFEVEVGSVSRKELESLRIKPFMLPLERDLSFSERNALEVYEGASKGQRFEDGGEMDDDEGVDLFEDYEDQPEEVSELLSTLEVEDYNYDSLNDLLSEMKKIGYTFDFGLDAEPYDLRKIGQKGKSEFYAEGGELKGDELENVRKVAKNVSKNSKEPIYVIEDKQYNYITKKPDLQYTWATQEDYEYMKEHTYPNIYISVKVKMRYENGELKSANEEVLFKNENYAKGGQTDSKFSVWVRKGASDDEEVVQRNLTKRQAVKLMDKLFDEDKYYEVGMSDMMAKGGETEKRKMILLESKSLSTPRKRVLTSQDYEKMYIYDDGVLYDTDYMLNKTTSYRMSKIDLTILPLEYNQGKMAEGGKLDESTKMVLSQNKAIAHHTEELKRALKKDPNVEPWVIGKVGRAETDISDVTHYLDGRSEYARGGVMKKRKMTLYESKLMAEKGKRVLVSHDAQQFYTIEEGVLYKTDDDLNHQEKLDMDKIDLTIKPMESYSGKYKKGGRTDIYLPVSQKISDKEIKDFEEYVNSFYGVGGVYQEDFNNGKGLNKREIKNAINKYFEHLSKNETWGYGDSMDRESVRAFVEGLMAKGGFTPNIVSKNNRKFGTSMYYERFEDAIGSFAWMYEKKYNEGILYPLSDFDKKYYSHLKLKDGEVLLRYKTERMIPSSGKYLIKINIDKGLVYFLNDSTDDDDKNPIFDSRGTKLGFLSIDEIFYDLDMYAKGGLTFDEKVKAVEKSLMSREVPKKYRNSYGKTFNKAEAHESAQKIIGAQVKKYNKK